MGQSSKQCSYVAMQLHNSTNMHIVWAKAVSNAAKLCCMQLQTCIYYGQSNKQCSYVAMQLQKLANMHILWKKQQAMQ